jgi:hypothetical protein
MPKLINILLFLLLCMFIEKFCFCLDDFMSDRTNLAAHSNNSHNSFFK